MASQRKYRNERLYEDDGDDILETINSLNDGHKWKWYIIRQNNTLPQLWSFLINTLTFYALFATPLVLVFSQMSEIVRTFEMFLDVCFTLDIICNFFKLESNQSAIEFKELRIKYLHSFFLFDCVAALPGLITLEAEGINFFKLARFVHYNRFFE